MDIESTTDIFPDDILPDGLPRILPPYENGVFQTMLTLPEAKKALVSVVEAVIDVPVTAVLLRNNLTPSRDNNAKQEQYDINCVVNVENGEQCNIEMQASHMEGDSIANEHQNIRWRSVFNLCDLHSNQEGRGLLYSQFVRSYQVMICNFKVFKGKQRLVERYTFRNPEGKELCDAVTVIFIDLSQAKEIAKKPVSEMSRLERWVVFFALGNQPKYREIIAEIIKYQEGIAVANEVLQGISQNPDERARFRSRRIWLQDREHEHAVWKEEGRQEGRKEGRLEGRQEASAEYESLIADKDDKLADKDAKLADKDAKLADKDTKLADKDALIAELMAQLNEYQ